jgi:hypothetical protein
VADEAWTEHYYGQEPGHPHPTCIETTTYDDRVAGKRTYICGPDCPKPAGPDPARDARINAYRDRERRRASRLLDRYLELLAPVAPTGNVESISAAGERFVEAVGDYVLARLGDTGLNVQQKSNYGASAVPYGCDGDPCTIPHHHPEPAEPHNADDACGASLSARCFNGERGCRVLLSRHGATAHSGPVHALPAYR